MPYEPTPEDHDVFIWENCDPSSSGTVIGWDVSGGVNIPTLERSLNLSRAGCVYFSRTQRFEIEREERKMKDFSFSGTAEMVVGVALAVAVIVAVTGLIPRPFTLGWVMENG